MITLTITMKPGHQATPDGLRAACVGKAAWAVDPPDVRVTRAAVCGLRADKKAFLHTAKRALQTEYARVLRAAASAGWAPAAVYLEADGGERVPLGWVQAPPGPPEPTAITLPPGPPEFGHLFGLGAQTRMVWRAVRQAVCTSFAVRPHVLLYGPPGCGKTELLLAFAKWLGPGRCWHVDSATLSKAGLEREIVARANTGRLPPWLVLEEVEKVGGTKALASLLSVMDTRGTISRLNGRDGEVTADARVQVLATCNDLARLGKWMGGALASRFAVRVQLPRPDRDTLYLILCRACGRSDWARVVVDYLYDDLHDTDPRTGLALLMGGDDLLDRGPTGFLADHRRVAR